MSDVNFVKGATAGEVPLEHILPDSMKSFSTQAQQELRAQQAEESMGVLVIRPWESAEELAARRAAFEQKEAKPQPTHGMDPNLAAIERARLLRQYDPKSPNEKQKLDLQQQINKHEQTMGIELTRWASFERDEKKTPKKILEAVDNYKRMRNANTKASIVAEAKSLEFLQLCLTVEADPKLREAIVSRISAVQLTAGE